MTTLIQDPYLAEQIRAQRQEAGSDKWDEVWDGVYILMPLPDAEHQQIVTRLAGILELQAGLPDGSAAYAGVNVSDSEDDGTRNYRCPDVAVFLPETTAQNRDAYWLGGPDFALEVISPDDRSREKLEFYARVAIRELLLIDRDPWALELYRLHGDRLDLVGRATVVAPHALRSEVIPLSFRLVGGADRPRIEITHHDGRGPWLV
jgi:Uma2 family endonuclease